MTVIRHAVEIVNIRSRTIFLIKKSVIQQQAWLINNCDWLATNHQKYHSPGKNRQPVNISHNVDNLTGFPQTFCDKIPGLFQDQIWFFKDLDVL